MLKGTFVALMLVASIVALNGVPIEYDEPEFGELEYEEMEVNDPGMIKGQMTINGKKHVMMINSNGKSGYLVFGGKHVPLSISKGMASVKLHGHTIKFHLSIGHSSSTVSSSAMSCGAFKTGDGKGGSEVKVGNQKGQACVAACIKKRLTDHTINGVTLHSNGKGGCYCEKKMSHRSTSKKWKSCYLQTTTCDAFKKGDGKGGKEVKIGNQKGQACVAACIQKRLTDPTINGVTVHSNGKGGCYCEQKMTHRNKDKKWKGCSIHDNRLDGKHDEEMTEDEPEAPAAADEENESEDIEEEEPIEEDIEEEDPVDDEPTEEETAVNDIEDESEETEEEEPINEEEDFLADHFFHV